MLFLFRNFVGSLLQEVTRGVGKGPAKTFPRKVIVAAVLLAALFIAVVSIALASTSPQILPFSQNWSNTGLITTNDNWNSVPGIVGYRGDNLTTTTGTDPQTITANGSSTPVDVIANQGNPNTNTSGGVAEFQISNPVVALQGNSTADAPHIVVHLNTTGWKRVNVAYNLRDIDGSSDNAVQPVALQYRIGSTGNYTNLPAGSSPMPQRGQIKQR